MPALTSQLNKSINLRGVTAALIPSLVGTALFEHQTPFRLRSLKASPGMLTQQVLRANGTGLLTFAYRLELTETDYDYELLMGVSFSLFGLNVSHADFRVDGPGVIPPGTFDSSPAVGYAFKFNYGLSVEKGSRFCFISTNAREFSKTGGKLKLTTGMKNIVLDIAAPVSTSAVSRVVRVEPTNEEKFVPPEATDAPADGKQAKAAEAISLDIDVS